MVDDLCSILLEFSHYLDQLSALLIRCAVGITELEAVYATKEYHELAEFLLGLGLLAGNLLEQLLGVDEGKAAFSKIEIHDDLREL